ncbi:Di-copper centre-containing protein [Martensiomyces pterosporus]|nr:Di-copper centre-containing protein [Martensiomyces pterosporus]
MKLIALATGLALLAVQPAAGQSVPPGAEKLTACTQNVVRKEVRSLSPDEWKAYTTAVNNAQRDKWNDWFGYLHQQVASVIHGNPKFLPFHRRFVRDYESVLRRYDQSIAIPYWNALVDYQQPDRSPILSGQYFGGNGDASTSCVRDGIAATWALSSPNSRCLQRKFNGGNVISSWYSPEYMTSVLQTTKYYVDLRASMENSLHGAVHLSLNGEMGTMNSPADPVFWIHHTNIDRLFAQWQAVSPSDRQYQYNGNDLDNKPVNVSEPLTHYNEPVYSVMRLGYGDMCYTYDTIVAAGGNTNDLAMNKRSLEKRDCHKEGHAQDLIKQLPQDVLEKFYPSFAKGNYHPLENEMTALHPQQPMAADGNSTAFKPQKTCGCKRGKMPKPSKLADWWIKMQGSRPCRVKKLEQHASDHVDALNKANYLSPYLF